MNSIKKRWPISEMQHLTQKTEKTKMKLKPRQISSFRNEVESLLKSLKADISNEYRIDEEDTVPGIQVTVGATVDETGVSWNYQTGDNSYTGGAYGHPHWAIIYLYRRSNCRTLAQDVANEIIDLSSQ